MERLNKYDEKEIFSGDDGENEGSLENKNGHNKKEELME